jgi:hypothetical protein
MTTIHESLLCQNRAPAPGMKSWPSASFSLQKSKSTTRSREVRFDIEVTKATRLIGPHKTQHVVSTQHKACHRGLPGEGYRLKVHTSGKLWSSNSHRANVAAEGGGTHRCSEVARRGWPAVRKRSESRSSSMTSGLLGRRRDIGMGRGRPWRFGSPRRGGSGGVRTARASSYRRGARSSVT